MQEVVFLADFRCPKCQHRVAEIMAKMNGKYQFSLEFYFFCAFGSFHYQLAAAAAVVVQGRRLIGAAVSGFLHRIPFCNDEL